MPRRTLVVVGHGMVAQRLLEALADWDTTGTWEVVVLGEEPRPAYDRVALSSYVAVVLRRRPPSCACCPTASSTGRAWPSTSPTRSPASTGGRGR